MLKVITDREGRRLKVELERLDEVAALKTAIENAIIRGQKSLGCLSDIPEWRVAFDEDLCLACVDAGRGTVGWVDDF